MQNVPTPHIEAKMGDISQTVIMPGDPLRAKFIAETFLTNTVCFNTVRNMLGFTGKYKGKPVSVMGSGMGMPSMGIYSYELFNFYNVKNIIRIGTAGSIQQQINTKDILLVLGACTDSNYAHQFGLPGVFAPTASFELLQKSAEILKQKGKKIVVGNILTSDIFYNESKNSIEPWQNMNVLAVEMETAALYMNAAKAQKNALCLLTISDNCLTKEKLSFEERQVGLSEMIEIALETAVS
jgi:purine-nucleoside phosphorylase